MADTISITWLIILFTSTIACPEATGRVGVNYGRIADNLPPPVKVVGLLKAQGIKRVKIFDTDPTVLTALANSGIKVIVCLPNQLLSSAASDISFADSWVKTNILKYYPLTKIEGIAVGNEVCADPNNPIRAIVPAMINIHASLLKYKLGSAIKVSSPMALSVLQSSYPPSSGSFKPDLVEPVMKPMLEFLRKTRSHLMVNAYPFFAYSANSDEISLDYALFKKNPGAVDPNNGLRYFSLLEAIIDAVYAAMSALKYNDIKIMVTETGWPSHGDQSEIGANKDNAALYNGNLVRRVLSGGGTPLRPHVPLDVFLFALFNEYQKPGPTSERNFGLFYPDERQVYPMASLKQKKPKRKNMFKGVPPPPGVNTPFNESQHQVPKQGKGKGVRRPRKGVDQGKTWCVANRNVGVQKLQAGLDYACGEGGVDCHPIQPGAKCFDPNTIEAHASYAFNSYYQMKGRSRGTCDFAGAAHVVTRPPKFGKCVFLSG